MARSSHSTRARWAAALTCTSRTPGTAPIRRSIVPAQAAQCMPSRATDDSQQPSGIAAAPASAAWRLKASHSSRSSSSDSPADGASSAWGAPIAVV